MPSLKSCAVSLVERCTLLGKRDFQTASYRQAKPAPRRSPRVSPRQNVNSATIRATRTYDVEECLPPAILLNSARKSGALDIEPELAREFLREYQNLIGKPNSNQEQELVSKYNINPSTVALLAGILRRCESKAQRALAKNLMISASNLGERSATFEIVAAAIRERRLSDYQPQIYRLSQLAKNERDRQAMTLLGKVTLANGKEREALEWFRRATRPPTGTLEFDGAGEALVHEGRILLDKGDKAGAESAFRKAALELDEPSAYFLFSQFQEPGSPEQREYLLKAAASGFTGAWHSLGVLELDKNEKKSSEGTSFGDCRMAKEWFQLAATNGSVSSMLSLAQICQAAGETDEESSWLKKAEEAAKDGSPIAASAN